MNVTVYIGGNLNELFLCDIRDMELPLGFEMLADAYGLNVSYETTEDQGATQTNAVMSQSNTTMKTKNTQKTDKFQLQKLNFPHCIINKTSSQKFVLKNLSGIQTSFEFDVAYFAPLEKTASKDKSELEKAMEEAALRAEE